MSGKVIGGRDSFLVIPLALILYFGNACIATEHKVEGDRMILVGLPPRSTSIQISIRPPAVCLSARLQTLSCAKTHSV